MKPKTLADALATVAEMATSMMDSAVPSDAENGCPMCGVPAVGMSEHEVDCGYRLARTEITPADIAQIRRLARVLRYNTEGA